MSYGALLTDANGVPFYIEDTMPLSLIEKRNITASTGLIDLFTSDGSVRYVFVYSNAPQGGGLVTCEALEVSGNVWRLRVAGPTRTLSIFIFGYQFQPIPTWGIQINDAQGRCILTNETKVLRDVQSIGDSSNPNNSGYVMNQTLNGEWAIAPVYTGYFTGVINQSNMPRPVVAQFASSARFNGSTTQIASGYIGNVDSSAVSVTYSNYRNRITAINVARY